MTQKDFNYFNGIVDYLTSERTTPESQILFGSGEALTEREMEIAFDRDLTLTEKLTRLTAVRGQSVKSRTFRKWLNPEDSIRARAFGVKL